MCHVQGITRGTYCTRCIYPFVVSMVPDNASSYYGRKTVITKKKTRSLLLNLIQNTGKVAIIHITAGQTLLDNASPICQEKNTIKVWHSGTHITIQQRKRAGSCLAGIIHCRKSHYWEFKPKT